MRNDTIFMHLTYNSDTASVGSLVTFQSTRITVHGLVDENIPKSLGGATFLIIWYRDS